MFGGGMHKKLSDVMVRDYVWIWSRILAWTKNERLSCEYIW